MTRRRLGRFQTSIRVDLMGGNIHRGLCRIWQGRGSGENHRFICCSLKVWPRLSLASLILPRNIATRLSFLHSFHLFHVDSDRFYDRQTTFLLHIFPSPIPSSSLRCVPLSSTEFLDEVRVWDSKTGHQNRQFYVERDAAGRSPQNKWESENGHED